MKSVYKYQIVFSDYDTISLPKNSTILRVDMQNNILCLWALVELDSNELEMRKLRITGTGHPIYDENLVYINTFIINNASLVFHVFEVLDL